MEYVLYEPSPADRDRWNNFVARNGGSFLQSYEWGEFQQSLGRSCWRFQISDFRPSTRAKPRSRTSTLLDRSSTELCSSAGLGAGLVPHRNKVSGAGFQNSVVQALVVKHELPLGKSYLYCPRGPVTELRIKNQELRKAWEVFLDKIKEIAKRESSIFLRIDPEIDIRNSEFLILHSLGFRKSPKEVQPKETSIVDLVKTDGELLAAMHPKTRYNIRLAQRRGVKILNPKSEILNKFEIQNSNGQSYFDEFWRLLQETAKRDGFRTHQKEYYQKQVAVTPVPFYNGRYKKGQGFANETFFNETFFAEYKGKKIAAAIVNFWNKRATYLHGASDYNHRNLMAPYLLHWEIMKEAKRRGFQEYDFWGIDEKKWPGITRFKMGFGGKEIEYVGAWDFVFHKLLHSALSLLTFFRSIV